MITVAWIFLPGNNLFDFNFFSYLAPVLKGPSAVFHSFSVIAPYDSVHFIFHNLACLAAGHLGPAAAY